MANFPCRTLVFCQSTFDRKKTFENPEIGFSISRQRSIDRVLVATRHTEHYKVIKQFAVFLDMISRLDDPWEVQTLSKDRLSFDKRLRRLREKNEIS